MGKLQLQDEEGKLLSRPRAVAALPWAGAGKLLIFLQCLALLCPAPPHHPSSSSAALQADLLHVWSRREKKMYTSPGSVIYLHKNTD